MQHACTAVAPTLTPVARQLPPLPTDLVRALFSCFRLRRSRPFPGAFDPRLCSCLSPRQCSLFSGPTGFGAAICAARWLLRAWGLYSTSAYPRRVAICSFLIRSLGLSHIERSSSRPLLLPMSQRMHAPTRTLPFLRPHSLPPWPPVTCYYALSWTVHLPLYSPVLAWGWYTFPCYDWVVG